MDESLKINTLTKEKELVFDLLFVTEDADNFDKFKRILYTSLEKYSSFIKSKKIKDSL